MIAEARVTEVINERMKERNNPKKSRNVRC